jgi:hypothetical protein
MDEAAPLNRYQLAELGSLLAEPARAAMLLALVDSTAWPAADCRCRTWRSCTAAASRSRAATQRRRPAPAWPAGRAAPD